MANPNTKTLGGYAEKKARAFLESKGMKFIKQNHRERYGEIDLIMKDSDQLIFVEVRSRAANYFGSALESITATKKQKIIKTAWQYLQRNRLLEKVNCRFDIVSFDNDAISWTPNAFYITDF